MYRTLEGMAAEEGAFSNEHGCLLLPSAGPEFEMHEYNLLQAGTMLAPCKQNELSIALSLGSRLSCG